MLLLIEAGILICILKVVFDENVSFLSALILTFVVFIAMNVLVSLFLPLGGIAALLLGGGIASVGLGVAISWLCGAPLKTATWISLAFLGICIALSIGAQLFLRT